MCEDERQDPILVVAANYNQAEYWMRKCGLKPGSWLYLHSKQRIFGRQQPKYVCVGEFYYNPNMGDILETLHSVGGISLTIEDLLSLKGQTEK